MKIGDLITWKIDYDAEYIEDIGIVTKIEPDSAGWSSQVATIAWAWGEERHRTCGLTVLSGEREQK